MSSEQNDVVSLDLRKRELSLIPEGQNLVEWHPETDNFNASLQDNQVRPVKVPIPPARSALPVELKFPVRFDNKTAVALVRWGWAGMFSWKEKEEERFGTILDLLKSCGTVWINEHSAKQFRLYWDNTWANVPDMRDRIQFSYQAPPMEGKLTAVIERTMFFEITGPTEEHVKCFKGEKSIGERNYSYDGVIYVPAMVKTSDLEDETVPMVVRKLFLLDEAMKTYSPPRLLDTTYYEKSGPSYATWSFDVHRQQVASAIKNIPHSVTLIAPADGYGVVTSMLDRSVIAGDNTKTKYTYPSVKKELMMETINRGMEIAQSCIVLSYCWRFLSVEAQNTIIQLNRPTMIIDAEKIDLPGDVIAPGLSVLAFPDEWYPNSFVRERARREEHVLYSENLLNLQGILYMRESEFTRYLRAMTPLGARIVPYRSKDVFKEKKGHHQLVAENLDTYLDMWTIGVPVYFCPLGKMTTVKFLQSRYPPGLQLDNRQLYAIGVSDFSRAIVHSKIPGFRHTERITQLGPTFFFYISRIGEYLVASTKGRFVVSYKLQIVEGEDNVFEMKGKDLIPSSSTFVREHVVYEFVSSVESFMDETIPPLQITPSPEGYFEELRKDTEEKMGETFYNKQVPVDREREDSDSGDDDWRDSDHGQSDYEQDSQGGSEEGGDEYAKIFRFTAKHVVHGNVIFSLHLSRLDSLKILLLEFDDYPPPSFWEAVAFEGKNVIKRMCSLRMKEQPWSVTRGKIPD